MPVPHRHEDTSDEDPFKKAPHIIGDIPPTLTLSVDHVKPLAASSYTCGTERLQHTRQPPAYYGYGRAWKYVRNRTFCIFF